MCSANSIANFSKTREHPSANPSNAVYKQLSQQQQNFLMKYSQNTGRNLKVNSKIAFFSQVFYRTSMCSCRFNMQACLLDYQQDGFLQNYHDCAASSKLLFLHINFLTFVKEISRLLDSCIFVILICFFFSVRFFVTFQELTPLLFLYLCLAKTFQQFLVIFCLLVQGLAN